MTAAIHTESEFKYHTDCEACGSSDALGVFTDGHTFCFSCSAHKNGEGSETEVKAPSVPKGKVPLLPKGDDWWSGRRITAETSQKFGYYKSEDSSGRAVHVAPFYDAAGRCVAQKLRYKKDPETGKKKFGWVGHKPSATLFGQHLWNEGGRKLIITEGEIDCLAMSQVQGNKWPVVSILDGASSAAKNIKENLEFVESFDSVILMFDMDEPGQAAMAEIAEEVLSPGKCHIASLPLNDPSDMLKEGRGDELRNAVWTAKRYQPEGFVGGEELWELMNSPESDVVSAPFPWPMMNNMIDGVRLAEISMWTGGPGSGKSTVCRQVFAHLLDTKETVGVIALEESLARVGWDMVGLKAGQMLHRSRAGVDQDVLDAAYESTLGTGRLHLYNHQGNTGGATLISKIRVMAKVLGCKYILLDHITIALTQVGSQQSDERLLIDSVMTQLGVLCSELNIHIAVVCHLKRKSDGSSFDDGSQVSQSDLRGSAALEQMSHTIISVERNQQSDEDDVKNSLRLRVLKDRWTGTTGIAGWLRFNRTTGRLSECSAPKTGSSNAAQGFKDESSPSDF